MLEDKAGHRLLPVVLGGGTLLNVVCFTWKAVTLHSRECLPQIPSVDHPFHGQASFVVDKSMYLDTIVGGSKIQKMLVLCINR